MGHVQKNEQELRICMLCTIRMLLVYMKNRRGTRTEHCETPAVKERWEESAPSTGWRKVYV